jgi:hypothetical protein
MKKGLLLITGLLVLAATAAFAERHRSGGENQYDVSFFEYYNNDSTLDWETFYAEWDTIPDSYYMYFRAEKLNGLPDKKMLWMVLWPDLGLIEFSLEYPDGYNLQLRFYRTKLNIFDVKSQGFSDLGTKGRNYNEAIKLWNAALRG